MVITEDEITLEKVDVEGADLSGYSTTEQMNEAIEQATSGKADASDVEALGEAVDVRIENTETQLIRHTSKDIDFTTSSIVESYVMGMFVFVSNSAGACFGIYKTR